MTANEFINAVTVFTTPKRSAIWKGAEYVL